MTALILVRATWYRGWLLSGLAAFHVNEQARRPQVSIACEIEIVDVGAFQGGCLLRPDVRREQQEPIANMVGRQICAATV